MRDFLIFRNSSNKIFVTLLSGSLNSILEFFVGVEPAPAADPNAFDPVVSAVPVDAAVILLLLDRKGLFGGPCPCALLFTRPELRVLSELFALVFKQFTELLFEHNTHVLLFIISFSLSFLFFAGDKFKLLLW